MILNPEYIWLGGNLAYFRVISHNLHGDTWKTTTKQMLANIGTDYLTKVHGVTQMSLD